MAQQLETIAKHLRQEARALPRCSFCDAKLVPGAKAIVGVQGSIFCLPRDGEPSGSQCYVEHLRRDGQTDSPSESPAPSQQAPAAPVCDLCGVQGVVGTCDSCLIEYGASPSQEDYDLPDLPYRADLD